jgi:phage-related protein
MDKKFEVILLEEALKFIDSLEIKTRKKIYYNLDKTRYGNDPKLFKKLKDEIWEFRTKYSGLQYRFFAFWDKTEQEETLVISTHGIIKKMDKVPRSEIEKAMKTRADYLEFKDKQDGK